MSRWPALRINHHCDDHGELLRDAIAPLVADVRAREKVRILVRPQWSEGPHVLVAMDVDEERFSREIYEPCRERLEFWIRSNPSPTHLDPVAYRRLTLSLAEAEAVPVGPDRLAPNNSVEVGWYDRAPPLGIAELAAVRDDFQVDTLDLALKLVAQRLDSRSRLLIELATLLATAGLCGGSDYDFWPISMLAHSEGFLSYHEDLRPSFEKLTAKLVPALAQSWRDRGITGEDRQAFLSTSPDLQCWSSALTKVNEELDALIERLPQLRDAAAMYDSPSSKPRPFLDWDSGSLKALMSTRSHMRYRIMLNFVYGLLPLIGLKPVERAFTCHLVWQTIQSSATELIVRADRSVRAAEKSQAA